MIRLFRGALQLSAVIAPHLSSIVLRMNRIAMREWLPVRAEATNLAGDRQIPGSGVFAAHGNLLQAIDLADNFGEIWLLGARCWKISRLFSRFPGICSLSQVQRDVGRGRSFRAGARRSRGACAGYRAAGRGIRAKPAADGSGAARGIAAVRVGG